MEIWSLVLARYAIYPDTETVLCAVGQFTSIQPFLDVQNGGSFDAISQEGWFDFTYYLLGECR